MGEEAQWLSESSLTSHLHCSPVGDHADPSVLLHLRGVQLELLGLLGGAAMGCCSLEHLRQDWMGARSLLLLYSVPGGQSELDLRFLGSLDLHSSRVITVLHLSHSCLGDSLVHVLPDPVSLRDHHQHVVPLPRHPRLLSLLLCSILTLL